MGFRLQQFPILASQVAQDLFDQTEMIYQDFGKNVMQDNIIYKAYYDKIANTSKLKKADNAYAWQPKADHQGSKIPFTDFR